MDGWAFVGIFVVVGVVLLSVPLILSALLAPRKPNPIKSETYECGMETYGDTRVKHLLERQVPFATFGKANGEISFPYVDVDGKRGIQLAIEHLISKGHERIGFISWPEGFRIGAWPRRGLQHRPALQVPQCSRAASENQHPSRVLASEIRASGHRHLRR